MSNNQRVRFWCFTDWPTPEYTEPSFDTEQMNYLIYGREICPDTGKDHFQGYVQFKKQTRFNTVKACFSDKVHIEVSKGTPEQAIAYCKKDGNFTEHGTPSVKGKRNDLMTAKALIDQGASVQQVANECFSATAKYYKFFEYYKQLSLPTDRTVFDKSYCTILWGDPGSGKSRTAYACDSYQVLQYNPQ